MSSICVKWSDSWGHWDRVLPRQTTLYGVTTLWFLLFWLTSCAARWWGSTSANKLSRYAVKNGMAVLSDMVLKSNLSCCVNRGGNTLHLVSRENSHCQGSITFDAGNAHVVCALHLFVVFWNSPGNRAIWLDSLRVCFTTQLVAVAAFSFKLCVSCCTTSNRNM